MARAADKVTIDMKGEVLLIGNNRPDVAGRIDPATYLGLARVLYRYEHDDSLRAAVLYGHSDNLLWAVAVLVNFAHRAFTPSAK
jgi:enoyl-CoA hydratase